MLVLLREESTGDETRLARGSSFLTLTQAIAKGGEYERGQRLEIAVEHTLTGDAPLAVWTPETGWTTTVYADVNGGDGPLLMSHLLLHEVTERLYTGTESFEPVAVDLCYLFAAIAKGTSVEWPEPQHPDDEGDRYTNVVKFCRGLFPEGHAIWKHITIQRGE